MTTLTLSNLHQHLFSLPDWEQYMDTLTNKIGKRFARTEAREQARAYLYGLLSGVERKNGWQLAEHLGQANPYRVQHLLDRAVCDADLLRDDLRDYVVEHLATPQGVLIVDETSFLKKGDKSVGVKRQYSGTAGRVENAQVGVFLSYATAKGHTFLDRALYLPQEWADDAKRRQAAHVPKDVEFATKPKLATTMLTRALDAGVPCAWVTGDSVYGGDPTLRETLQTRRQSYVLAIAEDERLSWEGGRIRALTLARRLPATAWQPLSAGQGAKGERLYSWGWVALDAPLQPGFCHGLLVRRSLRDATELVYYFVFAPTETALARLVQVAGTRWHIEVGFESAKGEVGLDHYEVRSWHGWYRHMTLSLLAHALLSVIRYDTQQRFAPTSAAAVADCLAQNTPDAAAAGGQPPLADGIKGGREFPRNSLRNFKQQRGLCCL